MFLSPIKALESGWIQGDVPDNAIQPNGIDFSIDRLFRNSGESFIVSPDFKRHRSYNEVKPFLFQTAEAGKGISFPAWRLTTTESYDGLSDFTVKLPSGVAAFIIGRSTFNRNGIFLTAGLYDSGFNGNIGMQIHNMSGLAVVGVGTRIGQIVFCAAESAGQYTGQYQNLADHWSTGK